LLNKPREPTLEIDELSSARQFSSKVGPSACTTDALIKLTNLALKGAIAMNQEQALRHFASDVINCFNAAPDVLHNKNVPIPDLSSSTFTPVATVQERPLAHALLNDFEQMDDAHSLQPLVKQLRQLEDDLIWGHAPGYNAKNVGQAFLDNYCHALLTGPDGPLVCDLPLGAFVLFGPHTLYKDHWHKPNEIYLALSSGGQWRVGDDQWRRLDAGQTIFIPSDAVHAIRTKEKPLLTFSFWLDEGDMESIAI